MPFNSLEVSPDGTCQVCCKIKKPILKSNGTPYNLTTDQLNDIWHSEDLQSLRKRFKNGEKPPECELCWTEEESNNISLRHHSFNIPVNESNVVEYLVLKLSNLCNLKCRICSPELSTQWLSEGIKNSWFTEEQVQKLNLNRSKKLTASNLETLTKWIPHLKRLLAYGGEPFLNDELIQVLDLCCELNASGHISFTANTNGTIFNAQLIQKLSLFKDVFILFSVDDINERFEYQRKNAKWSQVENNLKKFHDLEKPFQLGLFPTISLLNIFNLKNYLDWTLKFPKFKILVENTLHEPKEFSLRNAPDHIKIQMLNYLEAIDVNKYNIENKNCINVIKSFIQLSPNMNPESDRSSLIKHHLKSIDQIRNENYLNFLPELSDI